MDSLVFYLKEPAYLIGLSLVPVLLVFFLGSLAYTKNKLKKFGQKVLISRITPENSKTKQILKFALLVLAYCFIVLHIAGPVISFRKTIQNPADIFFLVDVSNSMLAEDVSPNRLSLAKSIILHHSDLWGDSRLGLIPFAGQSYISVPLTRNYTIFSKNVQSLSPLAIPVQGTLMSEALALALESYSISPERSKVIILITDGENHEAAAIQLAQKLKARNIHLLIIGVGSLEGANIPIRKNAKFIAYLRDRAGNNVVTKLNPSILRDLSLSGNGKFIHFMRENDVEIALIRDYQKEFRKGYQDQIQNINFPTFLIVSLILVLIEFIIFERKSKIVKKLFPTLRIVTILPLCLITQLLSSSEAKAQIFKLKKGNELYHQKNWNAAEIIFRKQLDTSQTARNSLIRYNLACTLFQRKDLPEAESYFTEVIQSKSSSLTLKSISLYNLGNIAFSQNHFEESIQYYIKSLNLHPNDKDALYNLAYARWKLKQKSKSPPPPPQNQEEVNQNAKQEPDPSRSPKQKDPVKPHLIKKGNGMQKSQSLEQNW